VFVSFPVPCIALRFASENKPNLHYTNCQRLVREDQLVDPALRDYTCVCTVFIVIRAGDLIGHSRDPRLLSS